MDRRDLLDKLQSNYRRYYKNLQTIEFTEQRLATLTPEYTDFLDGNLLWIRSSRITGPKDLKALPSALFWILDPRNWWLVLKDLITSFKYMPILWIPGLALVGALFFDRSRAKQHLSELAKNVGRVKKDSFMLTIRLLLFCAGFGPECSPHILVIIYPDIWKQPGASLAVYHPAPIDL